MAEDQLRNAEGSVLLVGQKTEIANVQKMLDDKNISHTDTVQIQPEEVDPGSIVVTTPPVIRQMLARQINNIKLWDVRLVEAVLSANSDMKLLDVHQSMALKGKSFYLVGSAQPYTKHTHEVVLMHGGTIVDLPSAANFIIFTGKLCTAPSTHFEQLFEKWNRDSTIFKNFHFIAALQNYRVGENENFLDPTFCAASILEGIHVYTYKGLRFKVDLAKMIDPGRRQLVSGCIFISQPDLQLDNATKNFVLTNDCLRLTKNWLTESFTSRVYKQTTGFELFEGESVSTAFSYSGQFTLSGQWFSFHAELTTEQREYLTREILFWRGRVGGSAFTICPNVITPTEKGNTQFITSTCIAGYMDSLGIHSCAYHCKPLIKWPQLENVIRKPDGSARPILLLTEPWEELFLVDFIDFIGGEIVRSVDDGCIIVVDSFIRTQQTSPGVRVYLSSIFGELSNCGSYSETFWIRINGSGLSQIAPSVLRPTSKTAQATTNLTRTFIFPPSSRSTFRRRPPGRDVVNPYIHVKPQEIAVEIVRLLYPHNFFRALGSLKYALVDLVPGTGVGLFGPESDVCLKLLYRKSTDDDDINFSDLIKHLPDYLLAIGVRILLTRNNETIVLWGANMDQSACQVGKIEPITCNDATGWLLTFKECIIGCVVSRPTLPLIFRYPQIVMHCCCGSEESCTRAQSYQNVSNYIRGVRMSTLHHDRPVTRYPSIVIRFEDADTLIDIPGETTHKKLLVLDDIKTAISQLESRILEYVPHVPAVCEDCSNDIVDQCSEVQQFMDGTTKCINCTRPAVRMILRQQYTVDYMPSDDGAEYIDFKDLFIKIAETRGITLSSGTERDRLNEILEAEAVDVENLTVWFSKSIMTNVVINNNTGVACVICKHVDCFLGWSTLTVLSHPNNKCLQHA